MVESKQAWRNLRAIAKADGPQARGYRSIALARVSRISFLVIDK